MRLKQQAQEVAAKAAAKAAAELKAATVAATQRAEVMKQVCVNCLSLSVLVCMPCVFVCVCVCVCVYSCGRNRRVTSWLSRYQQVCICRQVDLVFAVGAYIQSLVDPVFATFIVYYHIHCLLLSAA